MEYFSNSKKKKLNLSGGSVKAAKQLGKQKLNKLSQHEHQVPSVLIQNKYEEVEVDLNVDNDTFPEESIIMSDDECCISDMDVENTDKCIFNSTLDSENDPMPYQYRHIREGPRRVRPEYYILAHKLKSQ